MTTIDAPPVASPPASVEEIAHGWLLLKRGLFERPAHQGYTGAKDFAGRYSLEEAQRFVSISSGEIEMIHESAAPRFSPNADPRIAAEDLALRVDALLSDRAAMAERVAGLERERGEMLQTAAMWAEPLQGADQRIAAAHAAVKAATKVVGELKARAAASEAGVARLRKAMERAIAALEITADHYEEVEVGGVMVRPIDLLIELRAALTRPDEPTKET